MTEAMETKIPKLHGVGWFVWARWLLLGWRKGVVSGGAAALGSAQRASERGALTARPPQTSVEAQLLRTRTS